jgi:hypothetical protein
MVNGQAEGIDFFSGEDLGHPSLADRDRSWSLFLLQTFGEHGTVDRLLEWSTSTEDRSYINDDSLELCGIALSWFLTSSHRHVRDRATKGLVRLFQNRLGVLGRVLKLWRSQWVVATVARSLLAGVSKPKVFRGR